MALKDIIGQDRAINIILRTLRRGRIPSSYLFAGESGTGKKLTAIQLAKAVNCSNNFPGQTLAQDILFQIAPPLLSVPVEQASYEADCCDNCPSCKKIDSGIHPDFLLIAPQKGQIRAEEIRAIDDILSLKPFEGRKKIVIVDEADTMNQVAANAFLKTLEEPPPDSLIILISSNPYRLPDTIRSRCSRINFTPLSDEACKKVFEKIRDAALQVKGRKSHLKELPDSGPELAALVRLSMGRPGLAVSGNPVEEREWFLKLLQDMLNSGKDDWASREEMERWFDQLFIILRDMTVGKITGGKKDFINTDRHDSVLRLSNFMEVKGIIECYEKLNRLKRYFVFNLNKSLVWNYTGSLLLKMRMQRDKQETH
jgi:DNA polymerase-3 subunit delta'